MSLLELRVAHRRIDLVAGKLYIISRSTEECDNAIIAIASSVVSIKHCLLEALTDTIIVIDLVSEFGTFLNGKALPSLQRTKVVAGDILELGKDSGVTLCVMKKVNSSTCSNENLRLSQSLPADHSFVAETPDASMLSLQDDVDFDSISVPETQDFPPGIEPKLPIQPFSNMGADWSTLRECEDETVREADKENTRNVPIQQLDGKCTPQPYDETFDDELMSPTQISDFELDRNFFENEDQTNDSKADMSKKGDGPSSIQEMSKICSITDVKKERQSFSIAEQEDNFSALQIDVGSSKIEANKENSPTDGNKSSSYRVDSRQKSNTPQPYENIEDDELTALTQLTASQIDQNIFENEDDGDATPCDPEMSNTCRIFHDEKENEQPFTPIKDAEESIVKEVNMVGFVVQEKNKAINEEDEENAQNTSVPCATNDGNTPGPFAHTQRPDQKSPLPCDLTSNKNDLRSPTEHAGSRHETAQQLQERNSPSPYDATTDNNVRCYQKKVIRGIRERPLEDTRVEEEYYSEHSESFGHCSELSSPSTTAELQSRKPGLMKETLRSGEDDPKAHSHLKETSVDKGIDDQQKVLTQTDSGISSAYALSGEMATAMNSTASVDTDYVRAKYPGQYIRGGTELINLVSLLVDSEPTFSSIKKPSVLADNARPKYVPITEPITSPPSDLSSEEPSKMNNCKSGDVKQILKAASGNTSMAKITTPSEVPKMPVKGTATGSDEGTSLKSPNIAAMKAPGDRELSSTSFKVHTNETDNSNAIQPKKTKRLASASFKAPKTPVDDNEEVSELTSSWKTNAIEPKRNTRSASTNSLETTTADLKIEELATSGLYRKGAIAALSGAKEETNEKCSPSKRLLKAPKTTVDSSEEVSEPPLSRKTQAESRATDAIEPKKIKLFADASLKVPETSVDNNKEVGEPPLSRKTRAASCKTNAIKPKRTTRLASTILRQPTSPTKEATADLKIEEPATSGLYKKGAIAALSGAKEETNEKCGPSKRFLKAPKTTVDSSEEVTEPPLSRKTRAESRATDAIEPKKIKLFADASLKVPETSVDNNKEVGEPPLSRKTRAASCETNAIKPKRTTRLASTILRQPTSPTKEATADLKIEEPATSGLYKKGAIAALSGAKEETNEKCGPSKRFLKAPKTTVGRSEEVSEPPVSRKTRAESRATDAIEPKKIKLFADASLKVPETSVDNNKEVSEPPLSRKTRAGSCETNAIKPKRTTRLASTTLRQPTSPTKKATADLKIEEPATSGLYKKGAIAALSGAKEETNEKCGPSKRFLKAPKTTVDSSEEVTEPPVSRKTRAESRATDAIEPKKIKLFADASLKVPETSVDNNKEVSEPPLSRKTRAASCETNAIKPKRTTRLASTILRQPTSPTKEATADLKIEEPATSGLYKKGAITALSGAKEKINTKRGPTKVVVKSHIKIITTAVDPVLLDAITKKSQGLWSIAEDPLDAELLVMDAGIRTFKFLVAIAKGLPIVTSEWLQAVTREKSLVDFKPYFFKNSEFEKKYNFKLGSINEARRDKLFEKYHFVYTENIEPPPKEIQAIIRCGGGDATSAVPRTLPEHYKLYLISSDTDRKKFKKFQRATPSIRIIGAEGVMAAVMRQNPKHLDDHPLIE